MSEKVKKTVEKVVKAGAAALVGVAIAKGIPPEVAASVVDPLAAAVIAGGTYGALLFGNILKLKFLKIWKF